jgi:hypothetical protein
MRELTVRIKFTKASIGNVKSRDGRGSFLLPRNPQGDVIYLASWHKANARFAAQVLGKHQDEVEKICWDPVVDGAILGDRWHRRYYTVGGSNKRRHVLHEAFQAGQVVGVHCVVPQAISDDDFWRLMSIAGQYKGLSPYRPGEYGYFEVVAILPRKRNLDRDQADRPLGEPMGQVVQEQ